MRKLNFLYQLVLLTALSVGVVSSVHAQCAPASGEIEGEVYRDLNSDGEITYVNSPTLGQQQFEVGVPGITVNAYDSSDLLIASDVTDSDGRYSLSVADGTEVRIEFTDIPNHLESGPFGTDSATTTTFTSSPACDVNLGVHNPAQYCDDENPMVGTSAMEAGDQTSGTTSFVAFNWKSEGSSNRPSSNFTAPITVASVNDTGATWGNAFHKEEKVFLTSAVAKRHFGFGPNGTGGIYLIDVSDIDNPVVASWLDVQTVGINTGANPRQAGDLGAPGDANENRDENILPFIGKLSIGDIDFDEDQENLYIVNLFENKLHKLPIGPNLTPPSAGEVVDYQITNDLMNCSNDEFRPWAIEIHDGEVYVGAVCTAETSQDQSDLFGHILKLDEASGTFSLHFTFPLQYQRGSAHVNFTMNGTNDQTWQPLCYDTACWEDNYLNTQLIGYPMPNFSNFEFDGQGIVASLMSLDGLILARAQYLVPPTGATSGNWSNLKSVMPNGDVLRFCEDNSGVLQVENDASCGGIMTAGGGNGQGPGGGEYYYHDTDSILGNTRTPIHQDSNNGSVAVWPQGGEVKVTSSRPWDSWAVGTKDFGLLDAEMQRRPYQILNSSVANGSKGVGLGDLEVMCDPAPVEIGNRIWMDTDRDGIQDAGEMPIEGVTVSLYREDVFIASVLTNADGEYIFSDSFLPDDSKFVFGVDYTVQLDNLVDFEAGGPLENKLLTDSDQGDDSHDSDASLIGGIPTISFIVKGPGENNHTYDFGFYEDECPTDPDKDEAGICGCGMPDVDTDGDGIADCNEICIDDPDKEIPGLCGCGVSDIDSDGDGTPDCTDLCVDDSDKTEPGICGCGVSDIDSDGDGTPDCQDGDELVCEEIDISDLQRLADNRIKDIERYMRVAVLSKTVRIQQKAAGSASKSFKRKIRNAKETNHQIQVEGWQQIWMPDSQLLICNQAPGEYCVTVNNASFIESYTTNANLLYKRSKKQIKNFRKALTKMLVSEGRSAKAAKKKAKKAAKKHLNKITKFLEEGLEAAGEIPLESLLCEEPTS